MRWANMVRGLLADMGIRLLASMGMGLGSVAVFWIDCAFEDCEAMPAIKASLIVFAAGTLGYFVLLFLPYFYFTQRNRKDE